MSVKVVKVGSSVNIAAIVFPFFTNNYSRYISKICFPADENSKNILSVAIVANKFPLATTAEKYFFVAVKVATSF